jgi:4-hydroxythreonine-4-phosphate dehydrogenase
MFKQQEATMVENPIIGITMGDPAGNGPEITVMALQSQELYKSCRPIVIGDVKVMEKAAVIVGHPELKFNAVKQVSEAKFEYGVIDVLHMELIDMSQFEYGKVSAMCGMAAFLCIKKVIELAMKGEIDATCTNALNKEAMNMALTPEGLHFDGHTEIYATYTNTKKYTMMLAHHNLRVVHVSTHCSLREACERVKKERVLDVIRIADKACKNLGIQKPRIAVAGLNPHSGENGLFGKEEIDEIIPAIKEAQAESICVDGPVPPDSLFPKALGGWYDIVVAMYHDQGHIPLKTVGFVYDREMKKWKAVEGVNITLGLPIIRTSVDHGTGFDQAGKGTSNELSLLNAIEYAIKLANNKSN